MNCRPRQSARRTHDLPRGASGQVSTGKMRNRLRPPTRSAWK
jgi:hypothetical protein